ncbi:MAG: 6-bladed beta-propeller [Parabacteroides sp.]|nr:6-bladed beta-propeller [Parabacteroides sp.]
METNDSSLVQYNDRIILENGRLFVNDNNNNCLSFDEKEGRFLGTIGKKGQGPDEFVIIRGMDISRDGKRILISSTNRGIEYSIDGEFVRSIKLPEVEGCMPYRMAYLQDNLFLHSLVSWKTSEYEYCVATDSGIVKLLQKEYQPVIKDNDLGFAFSETTEIYRVGNVHAYRKQSDTIYTILGEGDRVPSYVLNLGKYRSSFKQDEQYEEQSARKNIFVTDYSESSRYSFFKFSFGDYAPEPFEETIYNGVGEKRTLVNAFVYGIYTKSTGDMALLNQPSPGKLGLWNDLDDGPVFWPQYISKEGKMAMLIDAEEFIEVCGNIKNPSTEIKKVLDRLELEDNPVLVVAY